MRRRRFAAGGSLLALVSAVVFALATLGSPSQASPTFMFTRLAGVDRYDTARVIATNTFPSGSSMVVLATGQGFADALAGAYAAGGLHAPILLTPTASLASSTASALQTLKARNIVILGGSLAVSDAVQSQLDQMGYSTGRVGGADRYETAEFIADDTSGTGIGTVNGAPTAIIASGEDAHFPDALSASPMSFANRFPILLTTTDTLAPAAQQGLSHLGIKHVLVVGGSAAVSDAVVGQIAQMGITVDRLAGTDRTDTAATVANYELSTLGFSSTHVNLARGDLFPDSLSGGPHAGQERAPIVLTEDPNTLGQPTAGWLGAHATPLQDGHVFGGTDAVSDAVVSQAQLIVQEGSATSTPTTIPPTTSTTGPPPPPMRLVSAQATAGTTNLSVTYSQQALCPSVSDDGSDYVASIVGGPHAGTNLTVTGASCAGAVDQTISITLGPGTPNFSAGDVVQIKTQQGTNGMQVSDAVGDKDSVGDTIQTTAS